jgi:hypothetical protein
MNVRCSVYSLLPTLLVNLFKNIFTHIRIGKQETMQNMNTEQCTSLVITLIPNCIMIIIRLLREQFLKTVHSELKTYQRIFLVYCSEENTVLLWNHGTILSAQIW